MADALRIEPFDPGAADPQGFAALHAFTNALRTELLPDDPPTPLAEAIAAWTNVPKMMVMRTWLARDGDHVIGRAVAQWADTADNRHLARLIVQVAATHRRRGVARRLLAPAAQAMRDAGRTVVVGDTVARAPAGAAFAERLGGTRGLETHVYQFRLDRVDRAALADGASDDAYEIDTFIGPYPEPELEAMARLREVMSSQPTGTLAMEHHRVTPAELRAIESAYAARGIERGTTRARHRATGELAGFTEVTWRPSAPAIAAQGDTGVLESHRGRGLARRLKCAMLARLLAEVPDARFVRTSNADSNAAMLRVNEALGFEEYDARTVWQVPLEAIEAYTAGETGTAR